MPLPTRFAPAATAAATAARTATAATASVATESAAATAAMTGALGPGTGFVDVDCTPIQVCAVERGDCAVGLGRVRHLDECEAAGLTCVAIPDYVDAFHGPVLFEQVTDRFLGSAEIQISDEDTFQVFSPYD
jgi:hypothetical protein